jgi:tetratricopeptide (TPR) repeat protein
MSLPRRKPFQRDYADRAIPLVQAIQTHQRDLRAALDAEDREEELHVRGPMGEAFRQIGQLDPAVEHLEAALRLARELNKPKFVAHNAIRLATAYQYMNRHEEAEPLFQEALETARKLGLFEDMALQQYGKLLAELGRWDEAIAMLEQALALRQARGDAEAVANTTEALEAARVHRPA